MKRLTQPRTGAPGLGGYRMFRKPEQDKQHLTTKNEHPGVAGAVRRRLNRIP